MESDTSPAPSSSDSTTSSSFTKATSNIIWDFDDVKSFKKELEDCLKNVHGKGSFSVSEKLESTPNPGLQIQGRSIGLPISDDDAKFMIEASHRAPFGKGEQTIVDESVRKTWEISGATEGLGISGNGKNVRAELYKMLIYEEGAMFKPHQDSEKAPGMFGTLVIALPSPHTGGDVKVTHAGRSKVLSTSIDSEFGSSYLAWYSDVVHEVQPVVSGRRVVLTYNLIHLVQGIKPLADTSSSGLARVIPMMQIWKDQADKRGVYGSSLAYRLAHHYTDNSLRYSALKGHDAQVVHILKEAAETCDFIVYLGNIKKTVEGGCDDDCFYGYGGYNSDSSIHSIVDEISREFVLKKVVSLDGEVAALELPYDEENLVQKSLGKPDDEDFSGPTGNEGVTTTHFYNRTVVILMPKQAKINFLLNPDKKSSMDDDSSHSQPAIDWLDRLKPILEFKQDSVSKQEAKEESSSICKVVLNHMKVWNAKLPNASYYEKIPPFKNNVITRVFEAATDLGDKELFLDLYDTCAQRLEPKDYFQIGYGINGLQIHHLETKLESDLSRFASLLPRLQAIAAMKSGSQTSEAQTAQGEGLRMFCEDQVEKALTTMSLVTAEDGLALANSTIDQPNIDITKIITALRKNVKSIPMVLAYLCAVFTQVGAGKRSKSFAEAVFRDIVSDVVDGFNLKAFPEPAVPPLAHSRNYIYSYNSLGSAVRNDILRKDPKYRHSSFDLACFLYKCWELECQFSVVVTKIVEDARVVKFGCFDWLLLPALKTLSSHLEKHQVNVRNTPFQNLYQSVLTIYLQRFVGPKPPPGTNWARPPILDCCNDCVKLNEFFTIPTQIEARFRMSQQRRDHLHTKCYAGDVDESTERIGSPHTMVLKKRNRALLNLQNWERRRAECAKVTSTFNFEMLRELLGAEYDNIMNRKILDTIPQDIQPAEHATSINVPKYYQILPGINASKPLETVQPNAPLRSISGNSGAIDQSGSRKRKRDVNDNGPEDDESGIVDLTGDE